MLCLICCVCVAGMGADHQVWHDDPEEDEGSASTVWRLFARHAGQTQEGNEISRDFTRQAFTSPVVVSFMVSVCVFRQDWVVGASSPSLMQWVKQLGQQEWGPSLQLSSYKMIWRPRSWRKLTQNRYLRTVRTDPIDEALTTVCNISHKFCWFSSHFLTIFIAGTPHHKPTGQTAYRHGLRSHTAPPW